MSDDLEDTLNALSPDVRADLERRGKAIADRNRALARLREIRRVSQRQLAERLGVQQSAVSKLERKSDLYISSIRRYVEAAGGTLEIVARFPDGRPVKLKQFGSLADRPATGRVEA